MADLLQGKPFVKTARAKYTLTEFNCLGSHVNAIATILNWITSKQKSYMSGTEEKGYGIPNEIVEIESISFVEEGVDIKARVMWRLVPLGSKLVGKRQHLEHIFTSGAKLHFMENPIDGESN